MSIRKITDLDFEREYPTYGDINATEDLTFNKEGLVIDYDTLSWDDIKTAYKKLFNTELGR